MAAMDSPRPGGSTLENLSKDDLIKFAKKQTFLLSKAKAKIEELSKEKECQAQHESDKAVHITQNNELQNKVSDLMEENMRIQALLAEYNQEIPSLKIQLEQVISEKEEAVNSYQAVQENLEKYVSKVQNLEDENECLKLQYASTVESVKTLQTEYQKQAEELQSALSCVQKTETELGETTKLKDKLVINFKALKQKYLETKKALDEKSSVDNSSGSLADTSVDLGEVDCLKSQVSKLVEETKEKDEIIERLNQQINQMEVELQNVSAAEPNSAVENSSSAVDKNSDGPVASEVNQVDLDGVDGIQQMESDLEKLKSEHSREISMWQERVNDLEAELQQVKESYDKSRNKVEELVLGLGQQSAEFSNENEKLQAKNAECLRQIEDLQKQISELTALGAQASVQETAEKTTEGAADLTNTAESASHSIEIPIGTEAAAAESSQSSKEKNKSKKKAAAAKSVSAVDNLLEKAQGSESVIVSELCKKLSELNVENLQLKEANETLAGDNIILRESVQLKQELVNNLERRAHSDLRTARTLQQQFQEHENGLNEQLAMFHEQREQMIGRIDELVEQMVGMQDQIVDFQKREVVTTVAVHKALRAILNSFGKDLPPHMASPPAAGASILCEVLIDSAENLGSGMKKIIAENRERTASFIHASQAAHRFRERCSVLSEKLAAVTEKYNKLKNSVDGQDPNAEDGASGDSVTETERVTGEESSVDNDAEHACSNDFEDRDERCQCPADATSRLLIHVHELHEETKTLKNTLSKTQETLKVKDEEMVRNTELLNSQLANQQRHLEDLQKELKDKEQLVTEKDEKIASLEEELRSAEVADKVQKDKKYSEEKAVETLESVNQTLREQIEVMLREQETSSTQSIQLIDQLQQEMQQMKESSEDLSRRHMSELEKLKSANQQQLDKLSSEKCNLEEEAKTLQQQLDEQKTQSKTEQTQAYQENEALLIKLQGLEQQCEELTIAMTESSDSLNLMKENLKKAEDRRSELESSLALALEERDELAKKHQELLKLADSLKDKNSSLQESLKTIVENKDSSQLQYDNLLVERNSLQQNLSSMQEEYENKTQATDKVHKQLTAQVDQINSQLLDVKQKLTEKEELIARLNEETAKISEERETLQSGVHDYESSLTDLRSQITELSNQSQAKNTENAELKSQLKTLSGKLNSYEEENKDKRDKEQNLLSKIEDLESVNQTLRQQTVEVQVAAASEIKLLNEKLTAMSEELEGFRSSNLSLMSELEASRKELMETSMSSQASSIPEESAAESAAKVKELEDKCAKFKMLALKAKKELMESRASVDKLTKELQDKSSSNGADLQKLIVNYQSLQEDYDRLQDELDSSKSTISALETRQETNQSTLSQLHERMSHVIEEKENTTVRLTQALSKIQAMDIQQTELKSNITKLEKELEAKQIEINEINKELDRQKESTAKMEVGHQSVIDKLRNKIIELEKKVTEARDELAQAHKTVSKSSLMDLEIADFEKTVARLQGESAEKSATIKSLEKELELAQQKNTSLESQLQTADEEAAMAEQRKANLQQALDSMKQELEKTQKEATEQKSSDVTLRKELETFKLDQENMKLTIANLTSERQSALDKLRSTQDSHQRLVRSMENKQRSLQSDADNYRSELTSLQQEYDSYKVRVHSVLKQQQTKASIEAALESEKAEREHIEEVLKQVKVKLEESSDKLQAAMSENSLLQEELDKLSLKHNKLNQDNSNKETVWRQRLDQLMLENSTIAAEHQSVLNQLTQQSETLSNTFKEQLQATNNEHKVQTDKLNTKIARLENEKSQLDADVQNLRQQLQSVTAAVGSKSEQSGRKNQQHGKNSPILQQFLSGGGATDAKSVIRESGEGMENPSPVKQPQNPMTSPINSTNTLQGLEQLLSPQATDADDSISITNSSNVLPSALDAAEEKQLRAQLQLTEKQAEHLRELLNDSEATCLRLGEQVSILKQEIRRLESNQQRESSISNMEYLKNIVYKVLTLEAGTERTQLVPVLHTMLKFTDDELARVRSIVTQNDDITMNQVQGSGWSGYLHRWTGFSS